MSWNHYIKKDKRKKNKSTKIDQKYLDVMEIQNGHKEIMINYGLSVNRKKKWNEAMVNYDKIENKLINDKIETTHDFYGKEYFKKYPNLFHKYLLNSVHYDTPINYYVVQKNTCSHHKFIAHFHFYDLKFYDDEIKNILENLSEKFKIIITFIIGDSSKYVDNFTYIKCENRGADIGPKICLIDFLYKLSIKYDYILFMLFKSNTRKRREYLEFIKNKEKINKLIEVVNSDNKVMMVYSKNMLYTEKTKKNILGFFKGHKRYLQDLYSFLDLPELHIFLEGNTFLLKKNVIDFLFKEKTNLFYNILNNYVDSFDLNWCRFNYNEWKISPKELYEKILNENLPGCDFASKNKLLPDFQIEHVFERLWLCVIEKLEGKHIGL